LPCLAVRQFHEGRRSESTAKVFPLRIDLHPFYPTELLGLSIIRNFERLFDFSFANVWSQGVRHAKPKPIDVTAKLKI